MQARDDQRPTSVVSVVSSLQMTFDFELPPTPTAAQNTPLPPSPFLQDSFGSIDDASRVGNSGNHGSRTDGGRAREKSKSVAGTSPNLSLPPAIPPKMPRPQTSYNSLGSRKEDSTGSGGNSRQITPQPAFNARQPSPSPQMESSLFPSKAPTSPLPSLPRSVTGPVIMSRQFVDSRDKPYSSPPPPRPMMQTNHSSPGLLPPSWTEVAHPPSPTIAGPRISPRPSMKSLASGLSIKKKRSTTLLPPAAPIPSSPAMTIGTPYQENAATFPLPQHVMTRPKTAGAATTIAGVTVPTHHTTQSISRPPLKPKRSSTPKMEQKAAKEKNSEPKPEREKKNESKRKTRLLNPLNLLQRRRSEHPDTVIDEQAQRQALARQRDVVASGVNTPGPNFDPRIKGNMVHDFSAPRGKRNTFDEMDMPAAYLTAQVSPDGTPLSPAFPPRSCSLVNRGPIRESAEKKLPYTPSFVEHLDEQPEASKRMSSIHAENLENKEFLQRVSAQEDAIRSASQESAVLPPFARRSQQAPEPLQVSLYHEEQPQSSSPPASATDRRESSSSPASSLSEVSPVTARSSVQIFSPISPSSTSKTSRPVSQFSGTQASVEQRTSLKKALSMEKAGGGKNLNESTTSRHYSVVLAPPAIETIEEGSVDGSPVEPPTDRFVSREPQVIANGYSYRRSAGPETLLAPAVPPPTPNNASVGSGKTSPTAVRTSDTSSLRSSSSKPLVEKRASAVGHSKRTSPSTLPKHQNSNASRFSFQLGEGSAAQELALEEKHRKIASRGDLAQSTTAAAAKVLDDDADDDDYFDEDAMDDMDEMEMQDNMGGLGLGIQPGLAMMSSTSSLAIDTTGSQQPVGAGPAGFYLQPRNHAAMYPTSPESESESDADAEDCQPPSHQPQTKTVDKSSQPTSATILPPQDNPTAAADDAEGSVSDASSLYDESNIPTITDERDVPYADHPAFRAHSAIYARNSTLPPLAPYSSHGSNTYSTYGAPGAGAPSSYAGSFAGEDGGYWRDSTIDGYLRDSVYYAPPLERSAEERSRVGSMLAPPSAIGSGMRLSVPGLPVPASTPVPSPGKKAQRPPLPQRDSGNSVRNRVVSGMTFESGSRGVTPREEKADALNISTPTQDNKASSPPTTVIGTPTPTKPARPPPPAPVHVQNARKENGETVTSPQLDPTTLAGLERPAQGDQREDITPLKRDKSFRIDGRRNGSVGGSLLTSPIVRPGRVGGVTESGDFESFVRKAGVASPMLATSPNNATAPLGLGLFQDFHFSSSDGDDSPDLPSQRSTPAHTSAAAPASASLLSAPNDHARPRPMQTNRSTMSHYSRPSDASHYSQQEERGVARASSPVRRPPSATPDQNAFRFPRESETFDHHKPAVNDDDDMYFVDDGEFAKDVDATPLQGGGAGQSHSTFDENLLDDDEYLARPNANHIVHAPGKVGKPRNSSGFYSTTTGSGDHGPYPTFALPSGGLGAAAAQQAKRHSQMMLEDLVLSDFATENTQQDVDGGFFPVDPKLIPQRNPSEDAKRGTIGSNGMPPLAVALGAAGKGGETEREMQNDLNRYFEVLAKAVNRAEREGRFDRITSMDFSRSGVVDALEDNEDEDVGELEEEERKGSGELPMRDESLQKHNAGILEQNRQPAVGSSPPKLGFDFGFEERPMSFMLGPNDPTKPPPSSTFPPYDFKIFPTDNSPTYPTDTAAFPSFDPTSNPYSFENSSADDDFDDDDLIAAANAEVLASDDSGFYGQEFAFYSRPRANSKEGEVAFENGGYFGYDGDDGLQRNKSLREPNLTPITERSEFSQRSSFVGHLPGGPVSAGAGSTGLLARMPVTPLMESEISGEELRRLRAQAFARTGSRSLKSEGSNRSSAQSLDQHGGAYFFPSAMHSRGTSGSESESPQGGGLLPNYTAGTMPMLGQGIVLESPTSPVQGQAQRRAIFDPYANNSTGLPVDLDATPRKAGTPSTWLDPVTVRKAMPRDISNSTLSPSAMAQGGSPKTKSSNSGAGEPGFSFGFPATPTSPHEPKSPIQKHERKPSDSVTYVREESTDGSGKQTWVLERRRTSEFGVEGELVAREEVRGGWI
ncbi:unnamed protein product [Zymoseptoria tritici ST99CH_3D7]|uniref:Uncharacterized protein n=1 Tax=Zymoseptoria tritici (strain ST99CH_3D7) TaxID=1276538 RepID=A0A1X7RMI1_ZYMT9|nr:unnamed protein product [Zymoseptoria tritici ST99CH_3D7]